MQLVSSMNRARNHILYCQVVLILSSLTLSPFIQLCQKLLEAQKSKMKLPNFQLMWWPPRRAKITQHSNASHMAQTKQTQTALGWRPTRNGAIPIEYIINIASDLAQGEKKVQSQKGTEHENYACPFEFLVITTALSLNPFVSQGVFLVLLFSLRFVIFLGRFPARAFSPFIFF